MKQAERNTAWFTHSRLTAFVMLLAALAAVGSWQGNRVLADNNNNNDGYEFYGTISVLPNTNGFIGNWTVAGKTVRVTSSTKVEQKYGALAVGAYVKVEGALQSDGSVNASEIETKSGGGSGSTKYYGNIEALPSAAGLIGNWTVGGKTVRVTATTYLNQEDGPFVIGAHVEVEGATQADGSINASKVETDDSSGGNSNSEFKGTIESLPSTTNRVGDWKVGGRIVRVTATTEIKQEKGTIAVGAYVEVKGTPQADGSLLASKIELEESTSSGGSGSNPSYAKFYGVIEALPNTAGFIGQWTVSGRKVNVSAATRMEQEHGVPALGKTVEVEGALDASGAVNAHEIEVKGVSAGQSEFYGRIEALPATTGWVGAWRVGGRTVNVTVTTLIKREYAPVAVGAFVEVHGTPQSDGSLNATRIEIKQGASASGGNYLSLTSPMASVSAASYARETAAASIVAAFGVNLAATTAVASALPLPTTLGGVSVLVDGVPTGLFFVSPSQINYALPNGAQAGAAAVVLMRNGAVVTQGLIDIAEVAPSLFTADASGRGVPAGLALRIKSSGQVSYEPLARFDAAMNKLVPATVQRNGERMFLVLYGAGIRTAANSDGNAANGVAENVTAAIGGVNAPVLFAGAAPGFEGLDQINIEIPVTVVAGQSINVVIQARNRAGSSTTANTVIVAIQ